MRFVFAISITRKYGARQTVSEEFATIRPKFRWGQLVALARVTANEYDYKSAGYEQAKELLNL